jgi:hypothetical protein
MQARKDAIANLGPLVGGMAVFEDFYSYKSGVYQKTSGSKLLGYHCICVVGYDDNKQAWKIKNSWGTSWGEGGFAWIKYGQTDVLIDSSWAFYSVDTADVIPTKGSGQAKHLLVDKRFGGVAILWAYVDGAWKNRVMTEADLAGLSQVLFNANRVDVWWDGNLITLIRPWRTY